MLTPSWQPCHSHFGDSSDCSDDGLSSGCVLLSDPDDDPVPEPHRQVASGILPVRPIMPIADGDAAAGPPPLMKGCLSTGLRL